MKAVVRCAAMWLTVAALGASPSLAAPPEPDDQPVPSATASTATPAPRDGESQPDIDLAAVLARAVAAYEADDLVSAQALFSVVHAHAPTARTLRSLGIVAFRQGRFGEALTLLEASLVSEVRPLTADQAEGVRALVGEAKGRLVASADLPLPVLAPPAPAAPPQQAAVPSQPEPERAERVPEAAAPRAHPAAKSRRAHRTGYALLGTGALTLVASATLTGLAYARLHELEAHCRSEGGCTESEARAGADARHLNLLANLGLAAGLTGGLSSVAGLTLLLLPARGDAGHGSVRVGWMRAF